jgi:FkbM family methyltransferase
MRFPSKSDCLNFFIRSGLEPETIIDVGVHTGTQELMAAFPKVHHLLIEPEAAHAESIARNYAEIPHTFIPAAASDRDGEANLTAEHRGGEAAVTHSRLLNDNSGSPVRLARLDTLVAEAGCKGPYLLKIDTDGHEMEVLAGAQETLKRSAIVVIEAPLHSISQRCSALEAAGLRLFDIVDLAYYFDTLAQVDLVFINPDIFNRPGFQPWQNYEFSASRWHQLQPLSAKLDPIRRCVAAVRRTLAHATRPIRR